MTLLTAIRNLPSQVAAALDVLGVESASATPSITPRLLPPKPVDVYERPDGRSRRPDVR